MGGLMFKTHYPKAVMEKWKNESIEDAIARGVEVEKVPIGRSGKRKNKVNNTIDPQKLLDKAIAAGKEAEAIKFLKSMGFEVE
jgi:hypothetical protein